MSISLAHTSSPNWSSPPPYLLQLTRGVDCRLYFIANLAGLRAGRLDGLDNLFGFLVGNFAEDYMFPIKPVGHDRGDEELGAVSILLFFPVSKTHILGFLSYFSSQTTTREWMKGDEGNDFPWKKDSDEGRDSRVGSGIGHWEEKWLLMPLREVLVCEFLAIDRLATGALGSKHVSTLGETECPLPLRDCRDYECRKSLTLPRVKSPPWSMKLGITRWNLEPL